MLRAPTIKSWCKLATLQHSINMLHINNLRKIQNIKVKTTTLNQRKENP